MNATRKNDIRFGIRVLTERKEAPTYNTYTDIDPQEAIKAYRNKYGKEPEECFTKWGLTWCGPVEAK